MNSSINQKTKSWKTKSGKYLFNHKALAKVFKGKLLSKLTEVNIKPPLLSNKWIVDCKYVGKGNKAIVYLGRYLYRGVIREKDIINCKNGMVTYRYQNSKTNKYQYKTVTGEYFIYLIMQHILPKGFRRARNYGFAHPNCKRMIALLHYVLKFIPLKLPKIPRQNIICKCCGGVMEIVQTRLTQSAMFAMVPI